MRDGIGALLGRIESTFKLRHIGIGFVWAWLYCVYGTPTPFDTTGVSINADGSWVVSAAAVVVAFFVGGFAFRHERVKPRSPLPILAPLALSLGTLFSFLGSVMGEVAVVSGGVLTGVGYALTSILWAMALAPVDIEELEAAIPLSTLVTLVCALIIPALQTEVAAVVIAALPLVSGALLIVCFRKDGVASMPDAASGAQAGLVSEEARQGESGHRLDRAWMRYLLRVSVLLLVIYLAIGWEAANFSSSNTFRVLNYDLVSLVSNSAAVLFAILLVLFSKRVSFSGLFRWVMPFLVVSLALFLLPGSFVRFGTSVINSTCDTLIEVLLFLFVLSLAKTHDASAGLCIGLANGFVQAGVLAGNLLGRFSASAAAPFDLQTMGLALIALIALAMIAIPQKDPVVDDPSTAGSSLAVDSVDEALARACLRIQERYGLSDRETEIAVLLAKGRTRPYIREQLFISTNTVATHIKHIYQKLNIHSKEELIDMVNSEASSK
ncbi:helix-turn-helix transcriptional regulator [Adlercreutzia shanghongiae]|uniref:Helix-turn-helix transcriptional regulator n=1 Tax=Adlercreutzia shanghongiae TaxID=3111773 RepID=A0ABU6IYH5_9ACTN|nr:helix-turn-helix transcriptional regulator [Adlercreutzia sp. R22]MEC4294912.1 helix-turn-helix transcriptional regulator [Adlercreutzia sp. R22]